MVKAEDYIDRKIDKMVKEFKDEYLKCHMMQENEKFSHINKRMIKASESKKRYENKYQDMDLSKEIKEEIDKNPAFSLKLDYPISG